MKMKELVKLLKVWREGAEVERAHTVPHFDRYSVGHHSHGVATIILALHPQPTLDLIKAALLHDLHEVHTGDIPAFAKGDEFYRLEEEVQMEIHTQDHLTGEDEAWLRAADRLELVMWCMEQMNIGNKNVARINSNLRKWFKDNEPYVPDPILFALAAFNPHRTLPIGADE